MITNLRSRVQRDASCLVIPPRGYILVPEGNTGTFKFQIPKSSTSNFSAFDFDLRGQVNMGMNLKPTFLENDKFTVVNQLVDALNKIRLDEYTNLQKQESLLNNPPAEPSVAPSVVESNS